MTRPREHFKKKILARKIGILVFSSLSLLAFMWSERAPSLFCSTIRDTFTNFWAGTWRTEHCFLARNMIGKCWKWLVVPCNCVIGRTWFHRVEGGARIECASENGFPEHRLVKMILEDSRFAVIIQRFLVSPHCCNLIRPMLMPQFPAFFVLQARLRSCSL